ncbi:MAG: glycosyltransferase family 4 protein [Solirubrobacteraceae bacterium]
MESPEESEGSMKAGSVVQVTLWDSPYLGNFMLGELALAAAVKRQFGLGTHFVLAQKAADQPWLGELDAHGVTWSILPEDRRRWRRHLDEVIAAQRAPLVHTHFTAADLRASAAAAAAGVPCIWHVRTGLPDYSLTQRVKDLFKLRIVARRRVARIIAVSPWLAELAAQRGAPRARIETIPNGIAAERFAELPDRATARAALGLDPDAVVVLCLGWWPDIKGVDLFVDALQTLAERHSNVNALLVGEQRMRDFLAERMTELPPWLRLSRFVEDSALLFAATDIFVSASRAEGQSLAIGEAFASGLPVVMSDIPGTSLWAGAPAVQTFPTGQSVPLAEALERLLAVPAQERVAAGAENRLWLNQNFSVSGWCERVCAVYRTLL